MLHIVQDINCYSVGWVLVSTLAIYLSLSERTYYLRNTTLDPRLSSQKPSLRHFPDLFFRLAHSRSRCLIIGTVCGRSIYLWGRHKKPTVRQVYNMRPKAPLVELISLMGATHDIQQCCQKFTSKCITPSSSQPYNVLHSINDWWLQGLNVLGPTPQG